MGRTKAALIDGFKVEHAQLGDGLSALTDIGPVLVDRARILAYQIRALVDVHCRKEEEVYVALLCRHLTDDEVVNALAVGDQMGHD